MLDAVAHRECKCAVIVVWTRKRRQQTDGIVQVIDNCLPQVGGLHTCAHIRLRTCYGSVEHRRSRSCDFEIASRDGSQLLPRERVYREILAMNSCH
jgi:hypothetical protein